MTDTLLQKRKFQALISATVEMTGDLDSLITESKMEVARSPNGTQQDHIERLIEKLDIIRKRANDNLLHEDKTILGDMILDDAGYDRFVASGMAFLMVPEVAVNSMMIALNRGAKNAELIYELILSELAVGLARWKVSFASNINAGSS